MSSLCSWSICRCYSLYLRALPYTLDSAQGYLRHALTQLVCYPWLCLSSLPSTPNRSSVQALGLIGVSLLYMAQYQRCVKGIQIMLVNGWMDKGIWKLIPFLLINRILMVPRLINPGHLKLQCQRESGVCDSRKLFLIERYNLLICLLPFVL